MIVHAAVAVAMSALTMSALAVPFPTSPTWVAHETTLFGTGLDIGDITGNGWLDLAVSNGNDMAPAANLAYLNQGGVLPTTAGWASQDARYSGHCVLADLDGDGYPELIVANYIGADWTTAQVQAYPNLGGTLQALPGWQTPPTLHSFRVAVGDPDGDGDLDLAVATGEAYRAVYTPNLVYLNDGGQLATSPAWTSAIADACYDLRFADMNGDGWPDLVTLSGGAQGRLRIYYNEGGLLQTAPGWTAAYVGNGNTLDLADLDGDGRLDALVGYNGQFAGFGGFAVFLTGGGDLSASPAWLSSFSGYGSAVVIADIDGDGHGDLITGGWWQPVRIYLNDGVGGFTATPQWQSDPAWASVVEAFALADLDAGLASVQEAAFAAGSRLLTLPHRHLQSVDMVRVGGRELPRAAWCADRRDGWVSLAGPADGPVTVTYRVSAALDLVVSNWDDGAYVFGHQPVTAAPRLMPPAVLTLAPNPFNPRTVFRLDLAAPAATLNLAVFDLGGRRVATLLDGPLEAGSHLVPWQPEALAAGVYVYRLQAEGRSQTGKVTLVR